MTLKALSIAKSSMGLMGNTEKPSKMKKNSSKKDHDEDASKAGSKTKLATRHLQAKRDKKKTKKEQKKKKKATSKPDKETDSILEHREQFDDRTTVTEDVDSILQHREKFDITTAGDVDSILQHREQFNSTNTSVKSKNHQQQKPQEPDWFDQESLAMDLESLRRKPWYKQNSETPLYEDQRFLVDPDAAARLVTQNDMEPDWDDIISQKTNQIEVRLSDDDEEDEDDWDSSSSDDSTDEEGSIVDSAKSKGTMDTIDEGYERGLTYQQQIDRFYNGAPVSKEHQELLEYTMKSVERLERIEELRESRAGYKKAKAERKQRRKERRALRRQEEEEARNRMLVPSEPLYAPLMGSHRVPVLIDLIDVCDRTNTQVSGEVQPAPKELQSLTVQRWKSSFKEEIPVIVDLTDYGKPQQILDLTNLSEPPVDISVPRARSGDDGCGSHRTSRRRLDTLRREREEKLHRMTKNIQKVAKKDPRENTLTAYQKLMKGVAKGFKRSVCGS